MFVTNNCRKLIACMMVIAFILTGMIVTPKPVKAEGSAPSVKVLGATLRLGTKDYDNNGAQSMLIGIQVDNADKAESCAIKLTATGSNGTERTYTVATKQDRIVGNGKVQTTLHSKDTTRKSIVYAVVLYNITEANFYSNISVEGEVWDMCSNKTSTTPENKNVMGVVNALKIRYPDLNISISGGTLYQDKNNTGTPAVLTKADLTEYNYNAEDPEEHDETEIDLSDLSKVVFDSSSTSPVTWPTGFAYDAANGITIGSSYNVELRYDMGFTAYLGDKVSVNIIGTAESGFEGFRCWLGDRNHTFNLAEGEYIKCTPNPEENTFAFDITKTMTVKENAGDSTADAITVKAISASKKLSNMTISSIKVTYLGGNPAPTATPVPTASPTPTPEPTATPVTYGCYIETSGKVVINAADALENSGYAYCVNGTKDDITFEWAVSGDGIQAGPNSGKNWTTGTIKGLHNIAPALNYRIMITNAGDYSLLANMSNPDNASDSYFVAVDGVFKYNAANGELIGAKSWYGVNNVINLTEGEHLLTIYAREDGLRINQLMLTTDKTNDQPADGVLAEDNSREVVSGPAGAYIEESGIVAINAADVLENSQYAYYTDSYDDENGKLTLWLRNGSGIQAAPENGGRSWGTGSWDGLNNIAPSINYKVNITNAGNYYVRINMSNPNSSADSCHVCVDGNYSYEIAGSPRTDILAWQGVNSTVSLSAGEHTITIFAREDGIVANQILLTTDLSNVPEAGVLATPSDRALLSE